MEKSRLLIVVNDPAFFLSHRLPVALGARCQGYDVHLATPAGKAVSDIIKAGFPHHEIPLSRSGKNPLREVRSLLTLIRIMRKVRPDIVHLVTIKPVLYGGIAARLTSVKGVVAAISGLGFVFLSKGLKASLLRGLVKYLYWLALARKGVRVIFQNPDDRDLLLKMKVLHPSQAEIIRGSGVDLSMYGCAPEPVGTPIVCMAARLLSDKGVYEFIEAAYLLHKRGVKSRFQLIGDADPGNPASVAASDLVRWSQERIVELLGQRKDVPELFALAHVVVLPSYREGLPKVLVEAAACGRAVVTTDVPGCRDAIEPGVSGLLVPVGDAFGLASAIEKLLADGDLRQSMGAAGRALAESEFAIDKIVQQHLRIYQKLEEAV